MKGSLQARLTLTHVGVALLAIALVAAIVAVSGSRRFQSYATAGQQEVATSIIGSLSSSYDDGWSMADQRAAATLASLNDIRLSVFDQNGVLLFTNGGLHSPGMGGKMGRGAQRAVQGWTRVSLPILSQGAPVATALLFLPRVRSRPAVSA